MELFSLKDKIIVITGACGLLGREHVNAVASAGGTPIILDLHQSEIDLFVNRVNKKFNVNCSGYSVNITVEKEIISNIKKIVNKYGKIDGLINNAANNPKLDNNKSINFSRLENFPINSWNNDIAVGLTGAFLCAKHYGYEISKNISGGIILNISSDLGLVGPDQNLYKIKGIENSIQPVKPVSYSVVKTGIIGLTRYIATYWADKNVRSNAICPGGVENNQNYEFIKELEKRIPLGRMAKKDEYQGIVIFLLSNASSYLNGSIITADGGRTAW